MKNNQDYIDWKNITVKELAGLISEKLRIDGIETVLVGGACVTIYSHNKYMSYDLDYVTYEDQQLVKLSLEKLGFKEKNKHFYHPNCEFLIEFVNPPIAIGKEAIEQFENILTIYGSLKLLRDVDCVKDRLASFYYWNDKESLNQALEVCIERCIDLKEIKDWSIKEGFTDKYHKFLEIFENRYKN